MARVGTPFSPAFPGSSTQLSVRPSGAHRHLSSKAGKAGGANDNAGDGGFEVSTASAPAEESKSKRTGAYTPPRKPDDGSIRAAWTAYCREVSRRLKLRKSGASEETVAEASEAIQERLLAYKARYNDPANAEEKQARLAMGRETQRRTRGKAAALAAAAKRDAVGEEDAAKDQHVTIEEADRARGRAEKRLRDARKASATAEVLASCKAELEETKANYKRSVKDPRNAEEAKALRDARRAKSQRYRAQFDKATLKEMRDAEWAKGRERKRAKEEARKLAAK